MLDIAGNRASCCREAVSGACWAAALAAYLGLYLDSVCVRSAALPTLDIAEGALDRVFEIYKRLLPQLGGYLTHAGQLHQARLERVLRELGALELDTLHQRAEVRTGYHASRRQRHDRAPLTFQVLLLCLQAYISLFLHL